MQSRLLPFYMTYPLPFTYEEEDTVMRDLEYLQQMYPKTAKKYREVVHETLRIMDYEGSFIYDEFPDRLRLEQITDTIVEKIKSTQKKESPIEAVEKTEETFDEAVELSEKWQMVKEIVQLVLFYEIYKRRHEQDRGFLKF